MNESKYPTKYVVDSSHFKGTCLTAINNEGCCAFTGDNIEELRIKNNNPHLIVITTERLTLLNKRYQQSLQLPFVEITSDRYDDYMECVPPRRMGKNWFYVGEAYYGNLHALCFELKGKFYTGLRPVKLSQEQIQQQINDFNEIISFRGQLVKEDSYHQSTYGNPKAVCTPYYFIDRKGCKHFIANLFSNTNDNFAEKDNRREMARQLVSLRKHNYQYLTSYGPEDIFKFFKWVQENNYTIQFGSGLFDFNHPYFVDFSGSIKQCSKTFRYRIYDRAIVAQVIRLLRTVKRETSWI